MAILDADDYGMIRSAIDVSLTAARLPDATIELPIYLGAAESEVLRRIPDAATRVGEELQHVKNAIALLVAALLAPTIPRMSSEKMGEYQYQLASASKVGDIVAELRGRADQELRFLELPSATTRAEPPFFFGLAESGR